jgi:hypothetical protein
LPCSRARRLHRQPHLLARPRGRASALDNYADDEGGDPLAWAFGALGLQDRARHLATLFLNDLADVLRDAVDTRFEFVRYGESLAQSQASFDLLATALAAPPTLVDRTLARLTREAIARHQPALVLISVPFPARSMAPSASPRRSRPHPEIVTVLGGGFVNTELRELAEPRVSIISTTSPSTTASARCSPCSTSTSAPGLWRPQTAARGQCRRPGQHLPPGR